MLLTQSYCSVPNLWLLPRNRPWLPCGEGGHVAWRLSSLLLADWWFRVFAPTLRAAACVSLLLALSSVKQPCCSSLISWLQPSLWPLKLSGVTCLAFWTIGMTMVLYLLLQKPLNHGLIVKVFDRLSMLPYHPQASGIFELWKFSLHCSMFSLCRLPSLLRKA